MTHKYRLIGYDTVNDAIVTEIELNDQQVLQLVEFDADDPEGVGCYPLPTIHFFVEPYREEDL